MCRSKWDLNPNDLEQWEQLNALPEDDAQDEFAALETPREPANEEGQLLDETRVRQLPEVLLARLESSRGCDEPTIAWGEHGATISNVLR